MTKTMKLRKDFGNRKQITLQLPPSAFTGIA